MFEADTYNLTQQMQGALIQGAVAAQTNPVSIDMPLLFKLRSGYAESPAWLLVQAHEFDPEPLTVERLCLRAVYSAPALMHALLELMASEKWFDRRPDGYHLSEVGRQVWHDLGKRRKGLFADYTPLSSEATERLDTMLRIIVDASLAHPDVPATWCLVHSRRRAHHSADSPAERIFQYCADLNAFRDDAHMSAYAKYNIKGYTWEAFSMVCDEKAHTADELFEVLAYRGFSRMEWSLALRRLASRGWLDDAHDSYQVTSTGRAIRDEVEQTTDMIFYAPWSALEATEVEELITLMRDIVVS